MTETYPDEAVPKARLKEQDEHSLDSSSPSPGPHQVLDLSPIIPQVISSNRARHFSNAKTYQTFTPTRAVANRFVNKRGISIMNMRHILPADRARMNVVNSIRTPATARQAEVDEAWCASLTYATSHAQKQGSFREPITWPKDPRPPDNHSIAQ